MVFAARARRSIRVAPEGVLKAIGAVKHANAQPALDLV
jgi:hypothetical protein